MRILISIVLLLTVLIGFTQTPFNQTFGTSSWEGSVFIMNEPDSTFSMSFIEEYNTALYRSFLLNIDPLGAILSGAHTNNYVNTIWNSHTIANNSKLNIGIYDATGNRNVLVQKVDSQNNEVWVKNYGGTSSDFGLDSQLLLDSGLLIVGATKSFGAGGYDAYMLRTDKNGDSLWTKTIGGFGADEAYAIENINDSSFYLCGTTSSFSSLPNIFTVKLEINGDTSSFKLLNLSGYNRAIAMITTHDEVYAICGNQYLNQNHENDFLLVKVDSSANIIFNKTYGFSKMDEALDLKETFDHGFILVGYSVQMNKGEDVYIVRTDSIGDTIWTRILGGQYNERAYSVVQAPDSGFAIVGLTYSFGAGDADAFFIKLNKYGDLTTNIGLIQPSNNPRLNVYPNPASDIVNIMIPDFFQSEKVSCEIIDASGRLLNRVEARDSQSIISIHIVDLEDGVYFIRVYSPLGFSIQKLIVRKSY